MPPFRLRFVWAKKHTKEQEKRGKAVCKTVSNMQHFFLLSALANNWPIKSKVCLLDAGRSQSPGLLLLAGVQWPPAVGHCMPGAHFVAICVPPFSRRSVANKGAWAAERTAARYVFYADCQTGLFHGLHFRFSAPSPARRQSRKIADRLASPLQWNSFRH